MGLPGARAGRGAGPVIRTGDQPALGWLPGDLAGRAPRGLHDPRGAVHLGLVEEARRLLHPDQRAFIATELPFKGKRLVYFSLTLGVANKLMEPWAGAVLAKILVLVFIILFIQKRPRGLFPQRGRAAEA